jgi:hypothetical protein
LKRALGAGPDAESSNLDLKRSGYR